MGKPVFSIKSSNLASGKDFLYKYHYENPKVFALLTDITSFIQIGDVLAIEIGKEATIMKIIELKEGEENEKIFGFLDSFHRYPC